MFVVDKIARCIQRYQDFEKMFQSHQGVRQAIGALWLELVRLCTKVMEYHSSRFRYLLGSFDRVFGDILTSIDARCAEADHAAAAAHMKEAKEIRERFLQEAHEQDIHRLRAWLAPASVDEDLERYRAEYLPGSLDWVIQNPQFTAWEQSTSSDSLLIFGPPGSGKSTLAAHLVHHLRDAHPDSTVLYFFCDYNDSSKNTSLSVRSTLLAQLLRSNHAVANQLSDIYRRSDGLKANSIIDDSDALREIINDCESLRERIFIIVDAEDECGKGFLASSIEPWVSDPPVKWLFTSRSDYSITNKVSVDLTLSTPFIREYTERRVHKIPHLADSDLGTSVVSRVTEGAEGLWLYARLMMDEIANAPSRELVDQYLQSLPRDLAGVYTRIMQTREMQMTEDERQFAGHLFLWLDISNVLPGFLSCEYDRLPYCILELVFRYVNKGNPVFDAVALARKLGAPLIQVHKQGSTYELDFLHRSAYQYLAESHWLPLEELPLILHPQKRKSLHRGILAMWYFTDCSDSLEDLQTLREETFYSRWHLTSERHFEMHYGLLKAFKYPLSRLISTDESEPTFKQILPMIRQLGEFLESEKCLLWVESATLINYSGDFPELLRNVQSMIQEDTGHECYNFECCGVEIQKFRQQCRIFFHNWAYVILQTTDWGNRLNKMPLTRHHHVEAEKNDEVFSISLTFEKPQGFDENKIATAMLRIGEASSATFQNALSTMPSDRPRHLMGLGVCHMCGLVASRTTLMHQKRHAYSCAAAGSNQLKATIHRRAKPREPSDLRNDKSGSSHKD
ncbi:Vegetative incompatibility protein HET-E-1 [Penicillium subrubescens]|uniref:Vegetative incompatibility protein HET-E-1 n=2 Tax=Penicillium subrubescens TaxID=1316194 RepID=A0A1Q5SNR7_9EURO|nr:Vegetative incompatibility protein HET-E-1 [Penicillium subrubescens]